MLLCFLMFSQGLSTLHVLFGFVAAIVLHVQSQQIVENEREDYVGKSQDTRGNVQVCGCVAPALASDQSSAAIQNLRQNCSKHVRHFRIVMDSLLLETDGIRWQSQI